MSNNLSGRQFYNCPICKLNIIRTDTEIGHMLMTRSRVTKIFFVPPPPNPNQDRLRMQLDRPVKKPQVIRYSEQELRGYLETVIVLNKCGHVFHKSCLRTYTLRSIRTCGELLCLVCRAKCQVAKDETRLYLDLLEPMDLERRVVPVPHRPIPRVRSTCGRICGRTLMAPFYLPKYLFKNQTLGIGCRYACVTIAYLSLLLGFFGRGTIETENMEFRMAYAKDEDLQSIEFDPFNINTSFATACIGLVLILLDLDFYDSLCRDD